MAKRRNLAMVLILWVITFGTYGLYWFYSTSDELIRLTKREANPLGWLILALIPVVNLFVIWLHATAVEELSKQDGMAGIGAQFIFILWLIPPLAVLLIQAELNTRAPPPKAKGQMSPPSVPAPFVGREEVER